MCYYYRPGPSSEVPPGGGEDGAESNDDYLISTQEMFQSQSKRAPTPEIQRMRARECKFYYRTLLYRVNVRRHLRFKE